MFETYEVMYWDEEEDCSYVIGSFRCADSDVTKNLERFVSAHGYESDYENNLLYAVLA